MRHTTTRRAAIGGLASTLLAGQTSAAQDSEGAAPPEPAAFAGRREPRPLSFDPAKLRGLSEKLIRSHWENNYRGSVKALNGVERRLHALMREDAPGYIYAGVKREELARTGSVILHELYFDNLGGPGEPAGPAAELIRSSYGSFETWEAEFRRLAGSLAGGSGWALLTYNLHTGELHNAWASDHLHNAPAGVPLLVLDMYEHAYHMDYGAAAARYVDAFFQNLRWKEVGRRLERARSLRA